MISVYVAGASGNKERARAFMDRVRARDDMQISYDWIADVDAAAASGVEDHALTDDDRFRYAQKDLRAICEANAMVALLGDDSRGVWVELGYAIALKEAELDNVETIITAGGDKRSIFTVDPMIDLECVDDDEAFAALVALAEAIETFTD